MKVVVPMAGRGSRFQIVSDQNPEYKKPKPIINVLGKPMIEWAMESLPFLDLPQRPSKLPLKIKMNDVVFICLEAQEEQYKITKLLKNIFSDSITVILIPEVTRGALETVLKAKEHINIKEDIIVTDSDHFFDGSYLYSEILNKDKDVQGIIPVFQPRDTEPKWSYALFGADHVVLAVGEKDAELAEKGANANIGAYYFAHGNVFVREAEDMIRANEMHGSEGKKEFYVAPLYQRMIKKGMKIKVAITPRVWGLGTPSDLEYFINNYKA